MPAGQLTGEKGRLHSVQDLGPSEKDQNGNRTFELELGSDSTPRSETFLPTWRNHGVSVGSPMRWGHEKHLILLFDTMCLCCK